MRIIPAIDIIEGKCVRLSQGDYSTQKIYNEDPLEVAMLFMDYGIKYLHLVDLDGAKAKSIVNYSVLERLASKTDLKIDFGGGIKSDKDLSIAFECGATQITGGSIAVKNPDLFKRWIREYGEDKIILGADVKSNKIAVGGWLETSEHEIDPFIKSYLEEGIKYVICTDISKDGTLEGPNIDLYDEINNQFNEINIIASGGVSILDDLIKLDKISLSSVVVGKSLLENKITEKEVLQFLQKG